MHPQSFLESDVQDIAGAHAQVSAAVCHLYRSCGVSQCHPAAGSGRSADSSAQKAAVSTHPLDVVFPELAQGNIKQLSPLLLCLLPVPVVVGLHLLGAHAIVAAPPLVLPLLLRIRQLLLLQGRRTLILPLPIIEP